MHMCHCTNHGKHCAHCPNNPDYIPNPNYKTIITTNTNSVNWSEQRVGDIK